MLKMNKIHTIFVGNSLRMSKKSQI